MILEDLGPNNNDLNKVILAYDINDNNEVALKLFGRFSRDLFFIKQEISFHAILKHLNIAMIN